MEQLALPLKNKQKVALEVILACPTFNAALKLCKELSGLTDDQICLHMNWTPQNFSMIWNTNGNKRNFPENDLNKYMELCGNEVPLIWLNHTNGYGMYRLKSKIELELEERDKRIAELEQELEVIERWKKRGLL